MQLPDGVLQEQAIPLVAYGRDVAALLGPEDVPGPADLQVPHRDLEPGPEFGELLDRLEPPLRRRGDHLQRVDDQVRVGPVLLPPDPAAELVQVGQPVGVRVVDEDGVRVRDVQPALDDRRRHQHVRLAVEEPDHRPLQLVAVHLPVADHELRVRDDPPHLVGDLVDVVDPVVDEVHLPAAAHLPVDRVADELVVPPDDPRLDRLPLRRRRLQVANLPDAQQRRVERPRDRRGGHRQHVHRRPQPLEPLLVLDPEPLLLVDDRQPEVLEPHVLRQQPVRADDHVDLARGHPPERLLLLRRALEPADHVHGERVLGEPLAEGAVVLLGKDSGGHEHGDLLAVVGRLERGPDGDLGLAVADVAADEPVHRLGLLQVGLHLGDGRHLVGRLLVGEGGLELGLPVGVGRERVAGDGLADGLELDHLGGHVADRLGDLLLLATPTRAAELRQLRLRLAPADVLLHQVDPRRRDVQEHAVAELEDQVLFGRRTRS